MQKLMGLVRRCVDDYDMIQAGDRIAVGVSGGKDSLVLLVLLAGLREYFNKPFELEAITIDMGLGMDYSAIEALCAFPWSVSPCSPALSASCCLRRLQCWFPTGSCFRPSSFWRSAPS